MTYYNTTAIVNNASNIFVLTQNMNNALDGWLGLALLLVPFVFSIISTYQVTNDFSKSVAVSTSLLFVVSVFLRLLGLIPWWAFVLCLIAAGFGAFGYQNKE